MSAKPKKVLQHLLPFMQRKLVPICKNRVGPKAKQNLKMFIYGEFEKDKLMRKKKFLKRHKHKNVDFTI